MSSLLKVTASSLLVQRVVVALSVVVAVVVVVRSVAENVVDTVDLVDLDLAPMVSRCLKDKDRVRVKGTDRSRATGADLVSSVSRAKVVEHLAVETGPGVGVDAVSARLRADRSAQVRQARLIEDRHLCRFVPRWSWWTGSRTRAG